MALNMLNNLGGSPKLTSPKSFCHFSSLKPNRFAYTPQQLHSDRTWAVVGHWLPICCLKQQLKNPPWHCVNLHVLWSIWCSWRLGPTGSLRLLSSRSQSPAARSYCLRRDKAVPGLLCCSCSEAAYLLRHQTKSQVFPSLRQRQPAIWWVQSSEEGMALLPRKVEKQEHSD